MVKQLYLPGTPILITRFLTEEGVGEVTDFMPVAGDDATDRHLLVRMVTVVRGSMTFRMEVQPRFNFGRDPHETELYPEGCVFRSAGLNMVLHRVRYPQTPVEEVAVCEADGGAFAIVTLNAGTVSGAVIETGSLSLPRLIGPAEVQSMFIETRTYWRNWLRTSTYTGRWREMVERSALTLKLLTYAPSGALIAAPTAGLPEQVGGGRNWDYRYAWVRDASYSVHALLGLGFKAEAHRYLRWLDERICTAADNTEPLRPLYRVDGTSDLAEESLDHFEGYKGSFPVRIGNGAAEQLQLDIYGAALNSIYVADCYGMRCSYQSWLNIIKVVNALCQHWDQPDESVWETRGGRRHFTFGRLMSWVAFDRAIRLAQRHGTPADLSRWMTSRAAIYQQIMSRGFDQVRQAFVQHYDTDILDASLLAMPSLGFIAADDPMWLSTLQALEKELVQDSLVYRYDPVASPDGLRGSEGTFSMCTFWYVEALARSGRLDDALTIFEKMLTYSTGLGLYAEQIAPTGQQLGNFPQAFSHLALIRAAMTLDRAMT
ncbi:glycoside hydrolase family 15 protein [Micromonospora lupini]